MDGISALNTAVAAVSQNGHGNQARIVEEIASR